MDSATGRQLRKRLRQAPGVPTRRGLPGACDCRNCQAHGWGGSIGSPRQDV